MRRQLASVGRGICTPKMVVRGSKLKEVVLKPKNATTQDIIDGILMADTMGDDFILEEVHCLEGRNHYETMQNVWGFVKKNVRYVADKKGHEVIKSPGALFQTGFGDCKSMTLAVNSILKKLKVPRTYRFAAYDNDDFTHVYAIAHTPKGDVKLDTVYDKFDDEVRYVRKKDYSLNGLGNPAPTASFGNIIMLGIAAWLMIKMFK